MFFFQTKMKNLNIIRLILQEGDDVYFECLIVAKPSVYKISWDFNVSIHKESELLPQTLIF